MDILSDPKFKNWVKANLAIQCVKDGLVPLVEHYCVIHSKNNIETVLGECKIVEYTCKSCEIKDLKKRNKNKDGKPCPSKGACDLIYARIKDQNRSRVQKWLNTDSTLWSVSPWEQMKSYIDTKGYYKKKNLCDADITAVVQICDNYKDLHTQFGPTIEFLIKVRNDRNEIVHDAKPWVSDNKMTEVFSHTTTCLQEVAKQLPDFLQEMDRQIQDIKRVESVDFEITTQMEKDAVKEAIIAIEYLNSEMAEMKERLDNHEERISKLETLSKLKELLALIDTVTGDAGTNADKDLECDAIPSYSDSPRTPRTIEGKDSANSANEHVNAVTGPHDKKNEENAGAELPVARKFDNLKLKQGEDMKDILILHSDDDDDVKLAREVEIKIKEVCPQEIQPVVDVYEDAGIGQGIIQFIDNMVTEYRFILYLVTRSQPGDAIHEFQGSAILVKRLREKNQLHRLVLMLAGIKHSEIKTPSWLLNLKPVYNTEKGMGWIVDKIRACRTMELHKDAE